MSVTEKKFKADRMTQFKTQGAQPHAVRPKPKSGPHAPVLRHAELMAECSVSAPAFFRRAAAAVHSLAIVEQAHEIFRVKAKFEKIPTQHELAHAVPRVRLPE